VSCESHCLIVSCFHVIFCFLFYIYPFKPNGILFPEGFSAPVRNPARLAVKKYRKRSEDDYFTATSPQSRLARLLRTRGYLCRKK
jgi:hypothetical protein